MRVTSAAGRCPSTARLCALASAFCLFASRVMTVAQTRRQQNASVFAFLVDACRAVQQGSLMPSLLPATR